MSKKILAIVGVVTALVMLALILPVIREVITEQVAGSSDISQVSVQGVLNDGHSNLTTASTNTPPTFVIPFGVKGYKHGSLQFGNMQSISFIIEASNDSDATSTRMWTDVTADVTNSSTLRTITTTSTMYFIKDNIRAGYLRLRGTTSTDSSVWQFRIWLGN